MKKIAIVTAVAVLGAFSGVLAGTKYIEAQAPVTKFTGLVVPSDAEPIVIHMEQSHPVGTETLQGGDDNIGTRLQPAEVNIQ